MHTYCRHGAAFPTPYTLLPFSQASEGPDSTSFAHLTCRVLTVGHSTATFVKRSSVDTETLLRLRLQDCGEGIRSGSYIPGAPDFLCFPRPGVRGSVRGWKDCLLKLPKLRQTRKYLHDVQHSPVLELIVLKAESPSPSAMELGDLRAPVGR